MTYRDLLVKDHLSIIKKIMKSTLSYLIIYKLNINLKTNFFLRVYLIKFINT